MKKIYDVLPVFLQNLLVSLYGFKLKNERFSSRYKIEICKIDFELSPTDEEVKELIFTFLDMASRDVPFYNSISQDVDLLDSTDLGILLGSFPIIKKSDIQADPKRFITNQSPRKVLVNHTSGSTGSPLDVFMSPAALQINYAFFHKFLDKIGLNEFDRSATFAGRLIVPKERDRPPFWRTNWAMKTLLLSSYHISESTFKDYFSALASWRPSYIDCYPSAIYELALLSKQFDFPPSIKLKAIVTSSETLFEHQRELIEDVFQCPVYDYYGCAEQAALAIQLPGNDSSGYRVPAQYCLIEVLDEDDRPVSPGNEGRLVCTNIFNSVMPLIRYDIGDSAILGAYYEGTRFAKSLSRINGRTDDVIKNNRGEKIGRLDPIFKGLTGIKESQIVQHSLGHLEVRIVKYENGQVDVEKLRDLIKERVGKEFVVDITYTNSIPRNSSGKFRAVVSKV